MTSETAAKESYVTNEAIILELVAIADGVDDKFARFVLEQVSNNLDVTEERVTNLCEMLIDDNWRPFLTAFIFPFERLTEAARKFELTDHPGGYVYVAMEKATGLVKIGISKDPFERIKGMNRNLPPTSGLDIQIPIEFHADEPEKAEKMLHDMYEYAGKHIEREWFELDTADIHELEKILLFRRGHFITRGHSSWSWYLDDQDTV